MSRGDRSRGAGRLRNCAKPGINRLYATALVIESRIYPRARMRSEGLL